MIRLSKALAAWNTPGFRTALKAEIEALDAASLPLQRGLGRGSYANSGFSVMLISVKAGPGAIHARAGIFYTSVIAGCSCADDPTPVDDQAEYCEVLFDIDRQTAETTITLLPE